MKQKIMPVILFLLLNSNLIAQDIKELKGKDYDRNTGITNYYYLEKDSIVELTFEYFNKNLKKEMNRDSIEMIFGMPAQDIGSGLYIYQYILSDSSSVYITFTNTNILQAVYLSPKCDTLKYIIEKE